jgi:DEAD/DEAH box helicase domain-containing protein
MVEELDIENRKCLVREANVNYYTDGLVKTDIKILTEDERAGPEESPDAVLGDVLVRSQVTKFKKLKFYTDENIGYGNINLEEEEMQTRSLVLLFGPQSSGGKVLAEMGEKPTGEALSGAGTLIRSIAPVFLMCDTRDLGIAERVKDPHFGVPALYIYDKYPGGTGLTESLFRRTGPLLRAICETLERCQCRNGCPSCVGPGGNKKAVGELLKAVGN